MVTLMLSIDENVDLMTILDDFVEIFNIEMLKVP